MKGTLIFLHLGKENSSAFSDSLGQYEGDMLETVRQLFYTSSSPLSFSLLQASWIQGPPWTDLHGQADGVEQDEDEHQVFKVGGVDHIPHFVLVLVLGDVPPQGPGLEGVFHTLSLGGR